MLLQRWREATAAADRAALVALQAKWSAIGVEMPLQQIESMRTGLCCCTKRNAGEASGGELVHLRQGRPFVSRKLSPRRAHAREEAVAGAASPGTFYSPSTVDRVVEMMGSRGSAGPREEGRRHTRRREK